LAGFPKSGWRQYDATAGLAVLYSEKGRLDQAYELCRKELERSPDRKLVHEVMAAIAMQAREYDRAISEYNALLITDPSATSVISGWRKRFG